jgi:hypothetical protein
MRRLVIGVMVVSLAAPAFAQDASRGGRHKKTEEKTQTPGVKADDKAYKSALDRLPAQTYDPWATTRPPADKH